MRLKRTLLAPFFIAFIVALLNSCDSSTSSEIEPPELPPVESLDMSYSLFTDGELQPESGASLIDVETPYSNFLQASARVLFLNGIVSSKLALPVAVIAGAEAVDPELNDEGAWEWDYSVSSANREYAVRITAEEAEDGEVSWSVFVTNSDLDLDSELLFSGVSSPDNTDGEWMFYQIIGLNSGEAVSGLSWEITNNSESTLRFEVLTDRMNRLGDTITLQKGDSVKKTIYTDAEENTTTEIEWNTDTKEGYLISPNYNVGEQACWDSNFMNTACE